MTLMRSVTWVFVKNCAGWRSVCFLRSPVTWKMARTRRSRRFKPKRRLRYANHRMWLKVSGLLGPQSRISRLIARQRANVGAG